MKDVNREVWMLPIDQGVVQTYAKSLRVLTGVQF
jgi:hypothetical protein